MLKVLCADLVRARRFPWLHFLHLGVQFMQLEGLAGVRPVTSTGAGGAPTALQLRLDSPVPLLAANVLADGSVRRDECLGLASVPHDLAAAVPVDSLARGRRLYAALHLAENLGDAAQVRRSVELLCGERPERPLPRFFLGLRGLLLRVFPRLLVLRSG